MLLTSLPPVRLGVGVEEAVLQLDRPREGTAFPGRYLRRAGAPAFSLSPWCGTCAFLFERLDGSDGTTSSRAAPVPELEGPLSTIDDLVLATFGPLLREGDHLPLLSEVSPELVGPGDDRDYFSHEQVATFGIDAFWGLPENPRSSYYRTFETAVSPADHLYEFVVPMVPPTWNDRGRVAHYRDLLEGGVTPTAVALSTLDVCLPATDDESSDYCTHWGLTHFLLDGHHKLEAAAAAGAAVRLLSLVSVEGSLAATDDLARLPDLLRRPRSARGAHGWDPSSRTP